MDRASDAGRQWRAEAKWRVLLVAGKVTILTGDGGAWQAEFADCSWLPAAPLKPECDVKCWYVWAKASASVRTYSFSSVCAGGVESRERRVVMYTQKVLLVATRAGAGYDGPSEGMNLGE